MGKQGVAAPRGRYNVEHKAKVSITLTEAQAVQLRREANLRGLTVSALVREILEESCVMSPPEDFCACGAPAETDRNREPMCHACADGLDQIENRATERAERRGLE